MTAPLSHLGNEPYAGTMPGSAISLARAVTGAVAVVALAGCLDPTTARPPGPATSVPAYRGTVSTVTTGDLGASWRPGCPVGAADLRRVRVDYWGYDGAVHRGDLMVARSVASNIAGAFGQLYGDRFQIRRIHPVTQYGADDDASMAANNTSAFNCRAVVGGSGWSEHAYGTAIDLNPVQNPYVRSATVLPPSGQPWADRSVQAPGMIHHDDAVHRAFAAIDWRWGGEWSGATRDYQHFSRSGR